MSTEKHYLALDLGAESGRGMLGTFTDGRLSLSEIHRFITGPTSLPTRYPDDKGGRSDSLVWDFVRFWQEIKNCIQESSKQVELTSLGVDTWGVDFALLDKNGQLLSFPYHYRDNRTNDMMELAFERMSREKLYEITGIQFMQLNTLFQLISLVEGRSPLLEIADKLVMVPDLINYWLTGQVAAEFTEATTSQIFDARKGQWSQDIISAMGFPAHIFPEVIYPGTVLGPLRPCLKRELACEPLVIAPPTHDTGCAVAAVPAVAEDYVWISSGTWSIIGMNVEQPVINAQSYAGNFTNEGGVEGRYMFSKNVTGLWIVQQCRRQWARESRDYSYSELTEMAGKAPHLKTIIDTDYSEFLQMGGMPEKINTYCQKTGQPLPENEGEMIRAVLQGLALRYRYIIEQLEDISGRKAACVHIVGGGTKNRLLNQFTADALGREVITGPIEATAVGSIMVQAITTGDISGWAEGAQVIRESFDIQTYRPGDQTEWNKAFEEFKQNLKKIKLAF
jgi:sugar (pentulose or hexulose) kinase